jgi:hypothetical protein
VVSSLRFVRFCVTHKDFPSWFTFPWGKKLKPAVCRVILFSARLLVASACGQFITPTNKFGVRKDLRSVEFWSLERDPGFTLVGKGQNIERALSMHGLGAFRSLEFARNATSNIDMRWYAPRPIFDAEVCSTSCNFAFVLRAEVGPPAVA